MYPEWDRAQTAARAVRVLSLWEAWMTPGPAVPFPPFSSVLSLVTPASARPPAPACVYVTPREALATQLCRFMGSGASGGAEAMCVPACFITSELALPLSKGPRSGKGELRVYPHGCLCTDCECVSVTSGILVIRSRKQAGNEIENRDGPRDPRAAVLTLRPWLEVTKAAVVTLSCLR